MENASATVKAPGQPASRWQRVARLAVLVAVVAFIALLTYGLVSKGTSGRIDQALKDGKPIAAPSFELDLLQVGQLPPRLARRLRPAISDGKLSLGELRGVPFVFNLWASWCEPCRQEAKPLQSAWQVAGARGVLFLGLDIQDLRPDAHAFLKQYGTTYPSLREPDRSVAKDYGSTGIPETFFIDARGRIVGHVIGAANAEQLGAGVAAAKTGQIAGVGEGGARSKQP